MADRLTIINDALLQTGNTTLNEEYDGTDEWRAADSAYRRALAFLLGRHRWTFATTTATLTSRLPATPSGFVRFANAFAFPPDFLHLKGAFRSGYPFTDFEIVDQTFCCPYDSGITIEYVRRPVMDQWPEMFVELLTMAVEARLLRGLNEDTDNARRRDGDVENGLAEVRAQSDQQGGRRAILRSRTAARRRGGGIARSSWPYGG